MEIRAATELFREADAATLLHRWSDLAIEVDTDARDALRKYLERATAYEGPRGLSGSSNLSGVPVQYRRTDTAERAAYGGRRFAVDGVSMQGMRRALRHTLARDLYHDVDVVNAHPTILYQWCARQEPPFPVPALAAYVADREPHLEAIVAANPELARVDRAFAKQVVLAVINGGASDADALDARPPWLEALRTEIHDLHKYVVRHPDVDRLKPVVERARARNVGGALTNHIICDAEDRILSAALAALGARGVPLDNVVLVFDGFMLPRGAFEPNNAMLAAMTAAARNATGYTVTFAEKPMDEGLDLAALGRVSRPPTRIADSHAEAGRMVRPDLHARVRFCPGGRVFARTAGGRVWTDHPRDAMGVIKSIVFDSGIKTLTAAGTPRPFAANGADARAIVERVCSDPPLDAGFPQRMREANMGKLFYADGVFDFALGERGQFRAECDDDLPAARIDTAFPRDAERDPRLEREVRERVLEAALGHEPGVVDTFLRHCARALACHVEDKDILVVLGERNSGKGSMTTALERAFGPYVGTANANSFILTTGAGGDAAKSNSWILACTGNRIVFTQEIKTDVENNRHRLDSNAVKLAVSGGDRIMARKNYTDEASTHFDGRMVMMANDFPPVSSTDVLELLTLFRTPYAYVSADKFADEATRLPIHRLADPAIKAFCRRADVANAFTHLVLDAYRREPVTPCAKVAADTVAFRQDLTSRNEEAAGAATGDIADLAIAFQFTRMRTDTVARTEAVEALEALGAPPISGQKLNARMEALGGVRSTNIKRDGKKVRGWQCVCLSEQAQAQTHNATPAPLCVLDDDASTDAGTEG